MTTSSRTLTSKAKLLLDAFKENNAAALIGTTKQPDSIPKLSGLPEVVVAGRANVGKSTFLNALMNRANLVSTGKKAGRTRSLDFYRVGCEPGSLVLVDSPGYGARGRTSWGTLWDRYIGTRKELRGIFILINAPHGITDYDRAMLKDLNERLSARSSESPTENNNGSTHVPILQPIFTKVDYLLDEEAGQRLMREMKQVAPIAKSPILCAIGPSLGTGIGVKAARWAVCGACAR